MANRPNKKAAPAAPTLPDSDAILTMGLDIGYGAVKAVAELYEPIIFPSVWGKAREIPAETGFDPADYPGDTLTDDSGTWFIGNLANKQLGEVEISYLQGRGANEAEIGNAARVRLAKAAIGKLFAGKRGGDVVHLRIATGLPVDHLDGSADLKAALLGQHLIKTDQAEFVANVSEVMVMPQPYGTIYANSLTSTGEINPCHTAMRTGVIDVGTYSIDYTVDDDGEYIDSESGSAFGGVFLAREELTAKIAKLAKGNKPKPGMVSEALLTKCIKIQGKTIDYSREVEAAYDNVRRACLDKLTQLWGAAAFIDVIYLSGGGASIVEKTLLDAGYSQVVKVENPQTANARGYLNYALWRAKDN